MYCLAGRWAATDKASGDLGGLVSHSLNDPMPEPVAMRGHHRSGRRWMWPRSRCRRSRKRKGEVPNAAASLPKGTGARGGGDCLMRKTAIRRLVDYPHIRDGANPSGTAASIRDRPVRRFPIAARPVHI
jgi:hypothetical protein